MKNWPISIITTLMKLTAYTNLKKPQQISSATLNATLTCGKTSTEGGSKTIFGPLLHLRLVKISLQCVSKSVWEKSSKCCQLLLSWNQNTCHQEDNITLWKMKVKVGLYYGLYWMTTISSFQQGRER